MMSVSLKLTVMLAYLSFGPAAREALLTTPSTIATSILNSSAAQEDITEENSDFVQGDGSNSLSNQSVTPHNETWLTGSSATAGSIGDQVSTKAGTVDTLLGTSSSGDFLTESSNGGTVEPVQWRWGQITWSWWTSLTLVSSILGILGNLLVILVIWQRRMMSRSTDTLIGSLAVADFCTSFFILPLPPALSVPSSFLGELYCRLVFPSYFFWLSVGSSIYTLTLISLERLIAVRYPIEFSRFSSRRYTSFAVVGVWSAVMIIDLFLIVTATVEDTKHVCVVRFSSSTGQLSVGILIFMVYFLVPATIMLLAQAVTAYILHKKSKRFQRDNDRNNRSNPSYNLLVAKNRVLKMLFMVVMIFIICWGPNNIAYFLFNVGIISPGYYLSDINYIFILLAFYNSCLNPIVYTVRHPKFRSAVRGLFTGSKPEKEALFEYKTDIKSSTQTKEYEYEPKI